MNKSLFSTGKDDWETPELFFEKINKIYNFTLDPCASHENKKCLKYYTKDDNGLSKSWAGEVVFMNPPYSKGNQEFFIRKAYEESVKGATVVCLIPARTDTKIWHEIIFPFAAKIEFLKGRLKFVGAKHSAPFPSALIVFKAIVENEKMEVTK